MEAERFMVEDLLNFTLDVCGEVVDDDENDQSTLKTPSLELLDRNNQNPDELQSLSPESAEEELEWLSNKDAFPEVETCLDILSDNPGIVLNHQSPVSVLETTTTTTTTTTSSSRSNSNSSSVTACPVNILVPWRYPMKARSKRRLRRRCAFTEMSSPHCLRWCQAKFKASKKELPRLPPAPPSAATKIGRRCQHCQVDKTPQWRAGPMGPKTLCNACGVRYKSGRLVPEYRPACSPTFSSLLHSNSHRKVLEMRKQKEMRGGMAVANGAC